MTKDKYEEALDEASGEIRRLNQQISTLKAADRAWREAFCELLKMIEPKSRRDEICARIIGVCKKHLP